MRFFDQSTGIEDDVEKVTSEKNTSDNWSGIMDVCDKLNMDPSIGKQCLRAIMKRMGHGDPHVAMQAITLLNACVNNCGEKFHLEVASREFEKEFKVLLNKTQGAVAAKMRQVLKSWAEGEFKTAPELNLIPTLYEKLRLEGHDFSNSSEKMKSPNKTLNAIKDPTAVISQQEEDDLAKAIELSLKEIKNSPNHKVSSTTNNKSSSMSSASTTHYPSLYPTFGSTTSGASGSSAPNYSSEPRKVRALYDFEAAEENELTFYAGEIIHVTDDSDPNWWKGFSQRGDGLFPSNFVTADLTLEPERVDVKEEVQEKSKVSGDSYNFTTTEINESKIDTLMHLLHEANPEDPSQDTEEMLRLEQEVHQMGPLIDAELEHIDRKHAQLSQLSCDLVDAINMYHSLMKDDRAALGSSYMMSAMSVGLGANMPGMINAYHHINAQQQMNPYGHSVASNFTTINPVSYNQQGPQVVPPQPETAAMSVPCPNGHISTLHRQQQPSMFTSNMTVNQHQQQQILARVSPAPVSSLSTSQMPLGPQVYANNVNIPTNVTYTVAPLNTNQAGLQQQVQSLHQASAPTAAYPAMIAATTQNQEQMSYTNNNVASGSTHVVMDGLKSINTQSQQSIPSQFISAQNQGAFVNTLNLPYQVQNSTGIANNNNSMHTNALSSQLGQFGHVQQFANMNLNNLGSENGVAQSQSLQTLNSSSYSHNIASNTPIYQQQR